MVSVSQGAIPGFWQHRIGALGLCKRRHVKAGLGLQVGVSSVGAAGQMLLFKIEMTSP